MNFDPYYMPVNTQDFTVFFADEDVRRHALRIIQNMKSLNNCEEGLSSEEYMDWRDTIMGMVDEFREMYNTHDLPAMEQLACHDQNSNNNNNNNNNNNVDPAMAQLMANLGYAAPEPALVAIPNSGETRHMSPGATNALTDENIKEGNLMVNFGSEYGNDRYHLKSSFNKWKTLNAGHKENPYTREPITNAQTYIATLEVPPLEGGKRQKIDQVRFLTKGRYKRSRKTKRRRHQRALSRRKRCTAAY
jgi:hypothetical protein